MSDKCTRDSGGAGDTGKAAPEACTRSGAFALALSVVLILLMPSWINRPAEIALAHYIGYPSLHPRPGN
jgi:hypothetical protein